MKIILCAVDETLRLAWEAALLAHVPALEQDGHILQTATGDITALTVDAVVSPANSYGHMRGGVDLAYAKRFGPGLEKTLQAKIAALPQGLLPVGEALCVRTGDAVIPYLISAPTMKTPMRLSGPAPIQAASRAAAACAQREGVASLAFPGMGTGTGGLSPETATTAMLHGIREALTIVY